MDMDWIESGMHHQFSVALAELRQVKKPLHQRLKEYALDALMHVFIPFAERIRRSDATVAALQEIGSRFMAQPRAFRFAWVIFAGWCFGLGIGMLGALLLPLW